jgi:AcrR family transcriptional regulator
MTSFVTPRRDDNSAQSSESYQALLLATRDLVADRGYHKITINDIIRRAGVSRATFYFYFRDKRHAFVQAVQSLLDEMYEVAAPHNPERDEYSRIILSNIAYLQLWRREARLIGEFFALSLVDDQVAKIFEGYRRQFQDRVEARLARLMNQGRIPETNPKLLAHSIVAMVGRFAFRFFATDEVVSLKNYTFGDAVKILSESWYRAVYGQLPPDNPAYAALYAEADRAT